MKTIGFRKAKNLNNIEFMYHADLVAAHCLPLLILWHFCFLDIEKTWYKLHE